MVPMEALQVRMCASLTKTGRQVDIQGIDNHRINDIPIVTAGGVVNNTEG